MRPLTGENVRMARIATRRAVAREVLKAVEASVSNGTPAARRRAASGSFFAGGCTSSMLVAWPAALNSVAYVSTISSAPLIGPAKLFLQKRIFIRELKDCGRCRVGTVPSAVAPGQLYQGACWLTLTRRYRARYCAYSALSSPPASLPTRRYRVRLTSVPTRRYSVCAAAAMQARASDDATQQRRNDSRASRGHVKAIAELR